MKESAAVKTIFVLLVVFNLKYLFLPLQIPFTLLFTPFEKHGSFVRDTFEIKENKGLLNNAQQVGFISGVEKEKVFDNPLSVVDFYKTQYAIAPAVLYNDINRKNVIGIFEGPIEPFVPSVLKIKKRVSYNAVFFERSEQ